MQKHMKLRAPQIAREFVGLWQAHTEALHYTGLLYIDALIEEAVAVEPMYKEELRERLCRLIPGLPYGTARRLVDLKYPHIDERECINVELLFQ